MNKQTRGLHHPLRFHPVAMIALVACGLANLPAVNAQEWRLQPELRIGGEYDDNARLSTDDEVAQKIDGYLLGASLGIGYATQRTELLFEPSLISKLYDEDPDIDSDDQFVDFSLNHSTLKGEFGIRSRYARESVRTAERANPDFDTDDPDEIPTDDTGLVFTNDERELFRVEPRFDYGLSERLSFGARASYLDVSYDEAVSSFLVDYSDIRVGGFLKRDWTQRTQAYVGVNVRRFENKASDADFDGLGADIGIESRLSQTTRLRAEIGYEDTELTSTGESDSSVVGNLSLVRNLETMTLLAQYRRNVSASGSGRVTERDSLNFNVYKDFTQRVSGGLGVRFHQSDSVGDQTTPARERDFLQFRAQIEVAMSRSVSLEADYRYATVDRSEFEGTADSNRVMLWLVYRPTPMVY